MSAHTQSLVALHCHIDTACRTVESIESCLRHKADGSLSLTYVLKGNVDQLRIPPPRTPRRADRLWEHTCFEAFITAKESPVYYEFNFSPSGEWAAYAFHGYRNGAAHEDGEMSPGITFTAAADHLELNAVIRVDRLPEIEPKAVLRVGLCAVIEEQFGKLSYWALKHPPGKPDFHHPDGFFLEIDPPVVDGDAIDYTSKP